MVRRGFVKDLFILMSMSLIGIIFIQFYLLRQALNTSEETFSRNVTTALGEATEKLRDQEFLFYLKKFEDLSGVTEKISKKNDNLRAFGEDSISLQRIEDIHTSISRLGNRVKDTLDMKKSKENKLAEGFKENHQNIGKSSSFNNPGSLKKKVVSLERYIRMIISGDMPIEKRIQPELIEARLDEEFRTHNIKPDYEFAVLNKERCPTMIRSKNHEEQEEMYDQALFLDENNRSVYYLSVYFPRKSMTILNSIFGIIILSVIVISVITGVYAASLFYMDRQKKISEMKNDFINNMTHEFKTPIATINVVTDILKNSAINTSPEKVKHYATLIKNENVRMDNQIEMVLRMAELDHNRLELDLKSVNLDNLVSKAVERIRLVVEKRQGNIFEDYGASSVHIHADPIHFENAILNILDNANKYSLDAPQITVRTFVKDQSAFIEVKDEGMGMPKQIQQKIFERFFRAEGGNLHNVKGHGLGLPYVKKIVDLHKAAIFVDSEKEKGSKFIIQVPLNN